MIKILFALTNTCQRKEKQDSGLTLIECLVAIAIIALTSASIAPVAVLSVATRVQHQKSEQALQIARGEIDRVRLIVEANQVYQDADLKLFEAAALGTEVATVAAPNALVDSGIWDVDTYFPSSGQEGKVIDSDEDGQPDFVMQSFRGGDAEVAVPGGVMPVVFDMGVRVYDYRAITDDVGDIDGTLETVPASIGFTSGEGERGRRPLAALYTRIVNSDNEQSLCVYMDFLQEPIPNTMICN